MTLPPGSGSVSHLDGPAQLADVGDDGREWFGLCGEAVPASDASREVTATGEAGDVYLCHPFLVHAAQRHCGRVPGSWLTLRSNRSACSTSPAVHRRRSSRRSSWGCGTLTPDAVADRFQAEGDRPAGPAFRCGATTCVLRCLGRTYLVRRNVREGSGHKGNKVVAWRTARSWLGGSGRGLPGGLE